MKIPPRSLGLGMYQVCQGAEQCVYSTLSFHLPLSAYQKQHDLSEKVLDEKLNLQSIDAVAEVGVNVNSCSAAILSKVPSLTPKLCDKIMKARPLRSRKDLLKVSGLGEKTFRTCAGFVRVEGGSEPLDATLVHPESYDLARWLLKELKWKLSDATSIKGGPDGEQREEWAAVARKAAEKFEASEDRVLTVIGHLYFSITSPDPRLSKCEPNAPAATNIGSVEGCNALPPTASTIEGLRESELPLRSIAGTVRNVVDFGVFVDVGLEGDGLLHKSKIGDVRLESLMVGQDIGVDVLGVSASNKVSLGLSGLNLPADSRDSKRHARPDAKKPPRKKQRKGK